MTRGKSGYSPLRVAFIGAGRTGGAGIAMGRIEEAVRSVAQGSIVIDVFTQDSLPPVTRFRVFFFKYFHRIRSRLLFRPGNSYLHSVAKVRTGLAKIINQNDYDLVHLHWIGDGLISIEEIGEIRHPIIWTLHDMWVLGGAEHVTASTRYADSYEENSRGAFEKGPDINRETFLRKKHAWQSLELRIVTPSTWLSEAAKKSEICSRAQIRVIQNPVSLDKSEEIKRRQLRRSWELSEDEIILSFGTDKGGWDENKGVQDLGLILHHVREDLSQRGDGRRVRLLTFGPNYRKLAKLNPDCIQLGKIKEYHKIKEVLSLSDFVLVPSRIDNFPNIALESLSAGTPVAGYSHSGVGEIVSDGLDGVLAPPFEPALLARKVARALASPEMMRRLQLSGQKKASNLWSYEKIGRQYISEYTDILESRAKKD